MNKPEALLIYPPVHDFALFDLFLKPYGLLRLGSLLRNSGWNTRVINCLDYRDSENNRLNGEVKRRKNGTGKFHRAVIEMPRGFRGFKRRFARYGISAEIFRARVSDRRPDVIFISTGMTYWYRGVLEAVETVRECWPDVPVITGGVYASLMPEHCASVCSPDFIFSGAAGGPSAGRLNAWLGQRHLPGIAPEQEGSVLPLDNACWNDAAVIRLNEGCPLNCDYCASKKISPCFVPGNAEDVFYWLKSVHELHGTSNFAFYDDALLFESENVLKPFLNMVTGYREKTGSVLNFYTPNAMHIRYIDSTVAALMHKAGFREVRLGFESESENFHAEHDRKYSTGSFHESIRLLTDAGFSREQIIVYILAGLPGQRADEVEETIRYAAGEGLTLSVSEYSPVPGSQLWDLSVEKSRYPLIDEPLYHNNTFFPMEWEGFSRSDMQRLKDLSKNL